MSKPIAQYPVVSFSHWKFDLPAQKSFWQWKPVYYFSGISERQKRKAALARKKRFLENEQQFEADVRRTVAVDIEALERKEGAKGLLHHAMALNSVGSLNDAAVIFRKLSGLQQQKAASSSSSPSDRRPLTADDFTAYLASLSAPRTQQAIHRTAANYDPASAMKIMGDHNGGARAAEAVAVFEQMAALGVPMRAAQYNALMRVLLTCGHSHAQQVAGGVYDAMGQSKVAPNSDTYLLVLQSLALSANVEEGKSVASFLRAQGALSTGHCNALLMGCREAKEYDECDILWRELAADGSRLCKPDVATCELYLRSIVDLSYTPVANAHNQYGGHNTGEKKRVPIVLQEMERLGLPRSQLSPPLMDEVEDALRKFQIEKRHFYSWGRSVRQFEFMEFRRRNGWLHNIDELNPTVANAAPYKPIDERTGKQAEYVAPVGRAAVPWSGKTPWMQRAGQGALWYTTLDENPSSRDGLFQPKQNTVHERSASWMSETPETRYDKLYGYNDPDVPKIGIRQHLLLGGAESSTKQDALARDSAVIKAALSGGRRMRKKLETAKTHRGE